MIPASRFHDLTGCVIRASTAEEYYGPRTTYKSIVL